MSLDSPRLSKGFEHGLKPDAQVSCNCRDYLIGPLASPEEHVADVGAAIPGARRDHAEGWKLPVGTEKLAENGPGTIGAADLCTVSHMGTQDNRL